MTNTFTVGRGLSAQELTRIGAAIAGTYVFPPSGGGAVTPSANLTVAVAAIPANTVTINGTLESSAYAGGTVTAATADPDNPRRDLVYFDQSGAVGIKEGTPAAVTSTTGPALPILDDDEIAVAELYIAANATVINSGDITDRRQDNACLATAEGPIVPVHTGAFATSALQNNVNTAMRVGLVIVPDPILVSVLRFNVTAVGAAGTLGVAMFSNDGQTRYFNETTSSISGTGIHAHTLSAAAYVPAGPAYIALNSDSTADISTTMWTSNAAITTAATAGQNELSGDVTVTAGTIPTTFDPDGDVSYGASRALVVRFN